MRYPRSAYDEVDGLCYFPRMLDKIRLHAVGQLPPEYVDYLKKGMNTRICNYLHVEYEKLAERVLQGGRDEEILEWAYTNGRQLNQVELLVWNSFMKKRGWNDEATELLEKMKADAGLADRKDIQTIFEFFEVDEKRKP